MEFHTIMTKPFLEKSDLIQNIFSQFDDEKQSAKLVQINFTLKEKISYILNICPEKIKNATQYQIRNSNLLLLIFLHEDISKIYSDSEGSLSENLEKMKAIKEDFLTLALIGDRVLEIGILPNIWELEKKSRDIPLKGDLDEHKKSIVENNNLAKIWDFLDFYDNKILTKKKNESQKLKHQGWKQFLVLSILKVGWKQWKMESRT